MAQHPTTGARSRSPPDACPAEGGRIAVPTSTASLAIAASVAHRVQSERERERERESHHLHTPLGNISAAICGGQACDEHGRAAAAAARHRRRAPGASHAGRGRCAGPRAGPVHLRFVEGGGRMLADDYGVPLFGELSIDPALRALCDQGRPAARAIADPSSRGLLEARNRSEGGAPVRTAFFPVPPPRSSPYGGGRSGFDVPAPDRKSVA